MKKIIAAFMTLGLISLTSFALPALAAAQGSQGSAPYRLLALSPFGTGACNGLNTIDATQGCGSRPESRLDRTIKSVLNILSTIVSIAAIIIIIIAGLRYVTSGGDSNGISSAKNTLIYAIVGLVIVALAQAIVHFVLTKTT